MNKTMIQHRRGFVRSFFYLYITDNEGEIIANITDLWGDSLKQTWMPWLAILTDLSVVEKHR